MPKSPPENFPVDRGDRAEFKLRIMTVDRVTSNCVTGRFAGGGHPKPESTSRYRVSASSAVSALIVVIKRPRRFADSWTQGFFTTLLFLIWLIRKSRSCFWFSIISSGFVGLGQFIQSPF